MTLIKCALLGDSHAAVVKIEARELGLSFSVDRVKRGKSLYVSDVTRLDDRAIVKPLDEAIDRIRDAEKREREYKKLATESVLMEQSLNSIVAQALPVYFISSWRLNVILESFEKEQTSMSPMMRPMFRETIKDHFSSTLRYLTVLSELGVRVSIFHPPCRFDLQLELGHFAIDTITEEISKVGVNLIDIRDQLNDENGVLKHDFYRRLPETDKHHGNSLWGKTVLGALERDASRQSTSLTDSPA